MVKAFVRGKFVKINSFKQSLLFIYKKIKKVKYKIEEKYTKVYIKHCKINPKKIVFDNFLGKGYGDNPKYIMEEIFQQQLNWDFVWLTNNMDNEFPKGVRVVKYGSLKAMREFASAKVWVDNVRNTIRPPKKKNQIYLQTWHGGFAVKKVEGAAESDLSEVYVTYAKRDGAETDAIISACKVQSQDFMQNFWLNKDVEILEIGQPRNDILFSDHKDKVAEKVKKRLGISNTTKVVLYAPTFRDDLTTDCYNLDTQAVKNAFEERFGGKFAIAIRLHPNVQGQESCFAFNDTIINATTYPDIHELYLTADYLISDYSSAPFDFSLLNRPVFLYVSDYEKYKTSRGLTLKLEDTPFLLSKSNMELVDSIMSFSEKEYWEKFEKFKSEYWEPYDKGNASFAVVNWIKDKTR